MESRNSKGLKGLAIAVAAFTYAGAVIYFDIQFLSIMQSSFMGGILGALAFAGAVMVGVSMLVLPVAMHFWFAPGLQFIWGVLFWTFDLAVMVMNAILAYNLTRGVIPEDIMGSWYMFSPATPIVVVVGWGLAFLLDPSQQLRHAIEEARANMVDEYKKEVQKAAKSEESYAILRGGARNAAIDFAEQISLNKIGAGVNGSSEEAAAKKNTTKRNPTKAGSR